MLSKPIQHPAPLTDWNCRSYGYQPDDHWEKLPQGWSWPEVAGVAVDSQDRVFVFNRGEHPVIIFDREGQWIDSWGEGLFVRAHGIFIGPDDSVYCTDDLGHTVQKFTTAGKLLLTLGTKGKASDTGATSLDYRTILRAGPPFHYPTNLALSPQGEMYVSDGYGNVRASTNLRPMVNCFSLGARSGVVPVNSTFLTGSRSTGKVKSMSPTAKTVEFKSSHRTEPIWRNGPMSPAPVRSTSMIPTASMWPNWAFALGCGREYRVQGPMLRGAG